MNISEFVKRAYLAYFQIRIGDQIFCLAKKKINYPNLDSLIHPVPHSDEILISFLTQLSLCKDVSDTDMPEVSMIMIQYFNLIT